MFEIPVLRRASQCSKSFAGGVLSVVLLLGASPGAQAASLSWDPDGSGILGGSGTWDTSSTNWWDGVSNIAWSDTTGASDLAIIGEFSGVVTLGENLGALGLVFNDVSGYQITGTNTLTLGASGIDASALTSGTTTISVPLSLAAAQSWSVGGGSTLVASGVIGGTGSLVKSGAGALQLASANTFSGGATLQEGSLILSGATATAGAGTLTLAGGNLIKAGGGGQNLTTGNALDVTGSTVFSAQSGGNWILSGAVTGGGTISFTNAVVNGGAPINTTVLFTGDLSGFTGTFMQTTVATAGNRMRFGASGLGETTIDLSNGRLVTNGATTGIGGSASVVDLADGTFGTFKIGELSGTGGIIRGGWVTGTTTFEVGALNTSASFGGVIENNVVGGGNTPVSALTKVGTGTLTLAGANIYTGATTVSAGTLQVGNGTAGSIAATSAVSVANGAALAFNQATGTTFSNNVANEGAVQGVQGSGITNTLSGVISGGGGVTQNGVGTMNLSGTNTYTGATLVSGGRLGVTGSGSINTTSGITVNGSSAVFSASSSTAVTPAVNVILGKAGGGGGGTIDTVNVANNAAAGIVTGAGGFTIDTLTLAGAADFNWTSASMVTVDTLTIDGGAGSLTISGTAASWTNGTFTALSATNVGGSGAGLSAFAVGNVTGSFSGLTPRQSATAALDGSTITLTIAGDFPKWTGNESSAWNTTAADNWALITGGGSTAFINGDAVLFDDSASNGTVAINGGNVSVSSMTFDNTTLDYTVSGANGITGSGALMKTGAGSVTLSTTNTFTGGATIDGGTLTADATGALGTGAVAVNGATLNLNAASSVGTSGVTINNGVLNIGEATALNTGALTLNNGTLDNTSGAAITLTNAVTVNGNLTFVGSNDLNLGTSAIALTADSVYTVNGSNLTVGGVISGGFALTKAGAGTLTLGGVNTYTGGTTVNGGTLALTKGATGNGLGANAGTIRGVLTINSGGTVKTIVQDTLGYAVGNAVTTVNVNGGTFDNAAATNQGFITNFVLTGGTVSSSGGGAINFSPGVGITTNASASSATWSAPILIRNASTLAINVADGAANEDLVLSGNISQAGGTGALTKSGAGTLTLSGANTYTGTTTISAGTLALGAADSIAASTGISIGAGATFDTTAQATFTILSTQPITFTLDPTGAGMAGVLAAAGLDITNGSIDFSLVGTLDDGVYILATYSSLTGSEFATVNNLPDGYILDYNYGGTNNTIALVPEPGTVVLTMIGLGAILLGMRRKRHVA